MVVIALAFAVAPALTSVVYADSPNWDEGCETPNGNNEPPGQQDECQGEGLTAFVENQGGNRPPGQQPEE